MQVTDHRMTFRGLISLIALSVALVVWPSTPQSQVTRHLSSAREAPRGGSGGCGWLRGTRGFRAGAVQRARCRCGTRSTRSRNRPTAVVLKEDVVIKVRNDVGEAVPKIAPLYSRLFGEFTPRFWLIE